MQQAIFLIGMPGAGKSTLGVMLAKALARPFIDTDLSIQQRTGVTLQDYVDEHGHEALREIEEQVLLEDSFDDAVVATGGSVVYGDAGMRRLGTLGRRVYLQISLATMLARVNNQGSRGLAIAPGTTLEDLYAEREALYSGYADITFDIADRDPEQALTCLIDLLAAEA